MRADLGPWRRRAPFYVAVALASMSLAGRANAQTPPPNAPLTPPSSTPPAAAPPAPSSTAPAPPPFVPAAPPGYGSPYLPYPYPYPYPGVAPPQRQDPYLLPALPPRRRRDVGLFAGGVTAVTVGVGAVLLGAYLAASAAGRIDIYCDTPAVPCAHKTDGERMTAGAVTMAIGGVIGVAGVPMWIIGSQFVTIPKGEPRPALVPALRVGLGRASATFTF